MQKARQQGFTLVELAVVLVIIGLLIGGVLVGKDMIEAARVQATITQIQKYKTEVAVFQLKYDNYLPGDIPDPTATRAGLPPRGQYGGEGDGNGVIEGNSTNAAGQNSGIFEGGGETVMFWVDLSAAQLIEGGFTTATSNNPVTSVSGSALAGYFPAARLGGGNYIYIWSGNTGFSANNGVNYFGLMNISYIGTSSIGTSPGLTVQQAYNIDKKMDDGLPETGAVLALTVNGAATWVGGDNGTLDASATPASSTTCYDNGNSAGIARQYSISQSNGAGLNCALSFHF